MPPHPSPAHTIWLREQQAAFVYLPKVACTSWKLFLGRALGITEGSAITYANVHDGEALALPYLKSFSTQEQQQFNSDLARGSIQLLAVIREPKERALSAYLDKILLHQNPASYFSLSVLPAIRAFHGLNENTKPDFKQFLEWIQANTSSHCSNDHWLPMCSILGLEGQSPSNNTSQRWTLWSMEAMNQAAVHIGNLLNYSGAFPSREDLGERPNRNSSKELTNYLKSDVEALLKDIYADDLKLYASSVHSQKNP